MWFDCIFSVTHKVFEIRKNKFNLIGRCETFYKSIIYSKRVLEIIQILNSFISLFYDSVDLELNFFNLTWLFKKKIKLRIDVNVTVVLWLLIFEYFWGQLQLILNFYILINNENLTIFILFVNMIILSIVLWYVLLAYIFEIILYLVILRN